MNSRSMHAVTPLLSDAVGPGLGARHQDQHRPEGFRTDRVGAVDKVRRQELGAVWGGDWGGEQVDAGLRPSRVAPQAA